MAYEGDEEDLTRVEPGCAGADRQDLPRSDIEDEPTDAERPETDVPFTFLDVP